MFLCSLPEYWSFLSISDLWYLRFYCESFLLINQGMAAYFPSRFPFSFLFCFFLQLVFGTLYFIFGGGRSYR